MHTRFGKQISLLIPYFSVGGFQVGIGEVIAHKTSECAPRHEKKRAHRLYAILWREPLSEIIADSTVLVKVFVYRKHIHRRGEIVDALRNEFTVFLLREAEVKSIEYRGIAGKPVDEEIARLDEASEEHIIVEINEMLGKLLDTMEIHINCTA